MLREALLRFKLGLIDESDQLASWVVENRDCCAWVGISCDNSTGHVHRVHLPGVDGHCHSLNYYNTEKAYEEASKQRLKGDINPSLLDLKQLDHLDLSCNDFGGIRVPKFIGSLENLRYLNLSKSNFGGIIPPQLGNLSFLHVLCLGSFHHSMMNTQWLSGLGMLHHLDMSGVDLSKATDWLHVITTLPSLVQLRLSRCELSNIHPNVPRLNITSLSFLDLSYNNFNSFVPKWIFSITSLVSLDLTWCQFHGRVSSSYHSFRNLTSLELLHVAKNDFMNSSLMLKELSGSKVVSLDVSSCGVSSLLLDSLHNLTSLICFQLSENQLTKRVPKSLGDVCNLRNIDLSHNNFGNINLTYLLENFFECKSPALESLFMSNTHMAGTIPQSIGHLSFLRTLDLSANQIYGSIPFSIKRLSSLEVLDLSQNQLNGSLPNWIGRLSSLKTLNLSNNRLYGSLPNSLGQLSNLITLDFSYNFLTGVVTESHFVNLVSLKRLLGTCNNLFLRPQVSNWMPPFQVQNLILQSWVLGPSFPLWLQSQMDIRYLDISNTSVSSSMPGSFLRSFPNLKCLNVSSNRIQGTLNLLGIPSTLVVLDLSSNEFLGSLDHFLCSNGALKIEFLNLGNNHLSGTIPECWEKWSGLVVLNMENNTFSGNIPRTIGSIPSLQSLNMRGNKISGILQASLMNLTGLKVLQLGKNEINGSIPEWVGTKLTLLRLLNLRSNSFDGNIPHELCYLIDVQILDLAHNNLSGNIPRCFNNFSVLTGRGTLSRFYFSFPLGQGSSIAGDTLVMKGREDTYSTILGLVRLLDLSSNNLVGHIPSEITSLVELKSLNLSRNQLAGRIPNKIGDMKELISFDLSLNKLSGELPLSLSRLSFLSSFNVSYNNLTGRIPTSTQLQSFSESSFFGNKLCGAPLTETNGCKPDETEVHTTGEQKEDDEDWGLIISLVVGFVSGFWLIAGSLIMGRSWRIVYFGFMSKLWYMVYDVMH
ncbi:receptor-like protein EIX2 [Bidens hawaiensis]|uniref:receptor-like protein EIX2 n=1 Tax=Bidens hawaiensis TaxID=980011 RepID=UPI00404AACFA